MHGGTLTASSQGENTGSTFVLRLPLMSATDDRREEAVEQDAGAAKEKLSR
jgi:hypothetical protein